MNDQMLGLILFTCGDLPELTCHLKNESTGFYLKSGLTEPNFLICIPILWSCERTQANKESNRVKL